MGLGLPVLLRTLRVFLCGVIVTLFPLIRHVQKACVSSLHDEGKLQVRKQLCLLPPWGKWTTSAPEPPR